MKPKITPQQRDELVKLFCLGGLEATAELTAKYGISPKYAVQAACALGIKRPRWRAGVKFKPLRERRFERGKEDPRWQWAISRGAI